MADRLAALSARVAELERLASSPDASADTHWVITCGIMIFLMQVGFTMLEAGSVRIKNTMNILLKNLMDSCLGALFWFLIGEAILKSGTGAFIDIDPYYVAMSGYNASSLAFVEEKKPDPLALWWFEFAFAANAATIVSGAMAERTQILAYIVYSSLVSGFIYPVVARWVWNPHGWLSVANERAFSGGVIDYAGSLVVHVSGGFIALWGAAIVGPRRGRFDAAGQPVTMPGHNASLRVLGTFFLWIGWYGFNSGSSLSISTPTAARECARVVVTTTLSAAAGGLSVCALDKALGSRTYSVSAVCNGILSGLVSVTAGCAAFELRVAPLVGCIGGAVYTIIARVTLHTCRVDDPLCAFAVHGGCGMWGTFAAALFANPVHGFGTGLFYGDARALGAASVAVLAVASWSSSLAIIIFRVVKAAGVLRVDLQTELVGLDVMEHGAAYVDPLEELANPHATSPTKYTFSEPSPQELRMSYAMLARRDSSVAGSTGAASREAREPSRDGALSPADASFSK